MEEGALAPADQDVMGRLVISLQSDGAPPLARDQVDPREDLVRVDPDLVADQAWSPLVPPERDVLPAHVRRGRERVGRDAVRPRIDDVSEADARPADKANRSGGPRPLDPAPPAPLLGHEHAPGKERRLSSGQRAHAVVHLALEADSDELAHVLRGLSRGRKDLEFDLKVALSAPGKLGAARVGRQESLLPVDGERVTQVELSLEQDSPHDLEPLGPPDPRAARVPRVAARARPGRLRVEPAGSHGVEGPQCPLAPGLAVDRCREHEGGSPPLARARESQPMADGGLDVARAGGRTLLESPQLLVHEREPTTPARASLRVKALGWPVADLPDARDLEGPGGARGDTFAVQTPLEPAGDGAVTSTPMLPSTQAALVPPPATLRAPGALPPDALELVAGLRAFDPLAAAALVAPSAARAQLEAPLAALGYARLEAAASLDAHTPVAGLRPDAAHRLLKTPLDVYELTPAARPLGALGLSPATVRAAVDSSDAADSSQAIERLARERDLEGLCLVLESATSERARSEPSPALAAFVRHRVGLAHADARALAQAARALKSGLAPSSPAAREALGFAARLLLPATTRALGIEGAAGRELDLALADALIAAAEPASANPLDELEPDADRAKPELAWPPEVVRIVASLRQPATPDDPRAPARVARAALDLVRAALAFAHAGDPSAQVESAAALGALGPTPEQCLALALEAKHGAGSRAAGLGPIERRRLYRSIARGQDAAGRRLVESALPELASLDRLVEDGLESASKASSRAELVSLRRRAGALALTRTAEVAAEPRALRAELDRAKERLDAHAKAAPPVAPRRPSGLTRKLPHRPGSQARPGVREPESAADDLDWELVALGIEEALLAPDADRAPLAGRARVALERWTTAAERAPLGFLAPSLRLLASAVAESPFPGEQKDPRRFEARALFHLARRAWKSAEIPRELLEAVVERRRSGVGLSELARKLDATVTTALLFEGLPRELAATLADELGQADLRLVRRLDAATLLGRFERGFVRVRFFPEDEPPLERARALVRPVGTGPDLVARPVAALDAARVRGGLGVGWALACAHVEGARLLLDDLPRGEDAPGFVAALARALAGQHAWGLVHGPLRLDEIVVSSDGRLCFSDWDLAASLAPDAAAGRARDLEALLAAAAQLGSDAADLAAARAAAGDLASEGAAERLATALEASAGASGRAAFERLRARRSVDREELRGLLRDALAGDALPRSLAEVEARVPNYLWYRGAVDQGTLRDELLALAEEGWASGEFSLEIDARRGVFRLVEASA